jgi:hypothetical protein
LLRFEELLSSQFPDSLVWRGAEITEQLSMCGFLPLSELSGTYMNVSYSMIRVQHPESRKDHLRKYSALCRTPLRGTEYHEALRQIHIIRCSVPTISRSYTGIANNSGQCQFIERQTAFINAS